MTFPFNLNYVGNHLRNYVVFGTLIIIGAKMVKASINGQEFGIYPLLDPYIGGILALIGSCLCIWNLSSAATELMEKHGIVVKTKYGIESKKDFLLFILYLLSLLVPLIAGLPVLLFVLKLS